MAINEVFPEYFDRGEFSCKCGCGFDTVDAELIRVLTDLREYFDEAVVINSGNRCKAYNQSVGGSPRSQHLFARAADVRVRGVHPDEVYAYLELQYPNCYGLGRYKTFTHIDTRSGKKARWDLR